MSIPKVPKQILHKVNQITGKRSRIVVEHILKHGSITTEDIESYGYKHPPRAIRDVREQGLPLEMYWTKSRDGKKISGYKFGNPRDIQKHRVGGRKVFSKTFQKQVIDTHDGKCAICNSKYERRYLQVDHRVPYEVTGDKKSLDDVTEEFMPLCGSCNRAKSWSCEHCHNWQIDKSVDICKKCYWGNPGKYKHIAMTEMKRLDIVWIDEEVKDFKSISNAAKRKGELIPEYVKQVLRKHVEALKTKSK